MLSFPGPDRSIRMEDLQAGKAVSRRYRNRRIGEFFKELDLTEGRSTGIPKILREMAVNGSPEPKFESDEDRSFNLVRLPIHPGAKTAFVEVTPQVTDPVKRLLLGLVGEMGRGELMEALKLKDRMYFSREYLVPALKAGVIEMMHPESPNSPTQKYRLTEKGQRIQEKR